MTTEKERKLQIEPVVQESVMHNARVSQTFSISIVTIAAYLGLSPLSPQSY